MGNRQWSYNLEASRSLWCLCLVPSLIIPRGQSVSGHVVQAKMCVSRSFASDTSPEVNWLRGTGKTILISIVLSFTNSLSRTSLYFSLKTSFVYSNLFSLAKTVTIRCYIQTSKRVRSPSSACKKARNCLKLQSINHFTIAACGNVMEFHSVLLFIDPSRLILMDSVICLSIASPW